jgi:hypothetical protein
MNATLDTTFLQTDEYRNYYIDVTEENANEFRFTAQILSGSTSYNTIFYNKGLRATSTVYLYSWYISNTRTISLSCLSVGRHYISVRHGENGFKTIAGSFQNSKPFSLLKDSPELLTYHKDFDLALYRSHPDSLKLMTRSLQQTHTTRLMSHDNNFLNIQLQEITADYASIYVQKDRLPTTSDYLTG